MRTTLKSGPFSPAGPVCLGEPVGPDTVVPGGARLDAAQFPRLDRVAITVTAAAAQYAETVTVAALTGPIPAGRIIIVTGGKAIRLRLAAAAGATTLYTERLPAALVGTETGEYPGTGKIEVLTATAIGRTYAERNAGTGFGPAATDGSDDEVYLTARHIEDAEDIDDVTLYRHGRIVYENFLPGVASMPQALLDQLRGLYQMTVGA